MYTADSKVGICYVAHVARTRVVGMELNSVIFVLFVYNFALLEARTPLVIGKLRKEKFCSWLLCFGMRMMSLSVQADRQYKSIWTRILCILFSSKNA